MLEMKCSPEESESVVTATSTVATLLIRCSPLYSSSCLSLRTVNDS